MNYQDLLIEIGTEELPPKALFSLSKSFQQEIEKGLKKHNLALFKVLPMQHPDDWLCWLKTFKPCRMM